MLKNFVIRIRKCLSLIFKNLFSNISQMFKTFVIRMYVLLTFGSQININVFLSLSSIFCTFFLQSTSSLRLQHVASATHLPSLPVNNVSFFLRTPHVDFVKSELLANICLTNSDCRNKLPIKNNTLHVIAITLCRTLCIVVFVVAIGNIAFKLLLV